MLYWLYERMLERQLTMLPRNICIMISGDEVMVAPKKICDCTRWCIDISSSVSRRYGEASQSGEKDNTTIEGLTYHISTKDPLSLGEFLPAMRDIADIAELTLLYGDFVEKAGTGMHVTIAIGKSGREEITNGIRQMACERVRPSRVDETMLESYLTFKYTPDFVIKTGGDHLTDFLIWQSVYSELFFSDVNWRYMRKVDFLRALRDYQSRVRRFGR
ncbi:MAG TPA: undecaprenyl diphosphate synthase family protein [Methanoregulaceae archaeon]|nr:undecaprenyl diphosphate synthase family protein [Methanoregulaceae archaeon]